MKTKLNFQEGDIIPPSLYLAYIKEAPPKIESNGKKRRRVVVKDIRNNEEFIADFDSIRSKGTVSSPSMRKILASQRITKEIVQMSAKKRRKYKVGDIIGPDNNILVLNDFEPIVAKEGEIKKKRRGVFKNLTTGIIFETTFNNVVCGFTTGLPLVEKSKGEYKIQSLLLENNVNFIREYIFDDFRIDPRHLLRFDFYLPDYNACIEYDGLQHYENHFGLPEDKYQHQLGNDKIKDVFCHEKNIKLIRIPYYDYDKIDWGFLWQKIIS